MRSTRERFHNSTIHYCPLSILYGGSAGKFGASKFPSGASKFLCGASKSNRNSAFVFRDYFSKLRASIFLLMSSMTSSVSSYFEMMNMASRSRAAGMTQTSHRIPS